MLANRPPTIFCHLFNKVALYLTTTTANAIANSPPNLYFYRPLTKPNKYKTNNVESRSIGALCASQTSGQRRCTQFISSRQYRSRKGTVSSLEVQTRLESGRSHGCLHCGMRPSGSCVWKRFNLHTIHVAFIAPDSHDNTKRVRSSWRRR